jgi:hypothetical protein
MTMCAGGWNYSDNNYFSPFVAIFLTRSRLCREKRVIYHSRWLVWFFERDLL